MFVLLLFFFFFFRCVCWCCCAYLGGCVVVVLLFLLLWCVCVVVLILWGVCCCCCSCSSYLGCVLLAFSLFGRCVCVLLLLLLLLLFVLLLLFFCSFLFFGVCVVVFLLWDVCVESPLFVVVLFFGREREGVGLVGFSTQRFFVFLDHSEWGLQSEQRGGEWSWSRKDFDLHGFLSFWDYCLLISKIFFAFLDDSQV